MIKRWWLRFKHRNTSKDDLIELNELLIMAGRSVTHDLDHVVGTLEMEVDDTFLTDLMYDRLKVWKAVFYPDKGPKNYRSELHKELFDLEREVGRLERLCKEHDIEYREIPF